MATEFGPDTPQFNPPLSIPEEELPQVPDPTELAEPLGQHKDNPT